MLGTDQLIRVQYPPHGPSRQQGSVSGEERGSMMSISGMRWWKYPDLSSDLARVKLVRRSRVLRSNISKWEIGIRSLLHTSETRVKHYQWLRVRIFTEPVIAWKRAFIAVCQRRINYISSEFHDQNQNEDGRYGVTWVKQACKIDYRRIAVFNLCINWNALNLHHSNSVHRYS